MKSRKGSRRSLPPSSSCSAGSRAHRSRWDRSRSLGRSRFSPETRPTRSSPGSRTFRPRTARRRWSGRSSKQWCCPEFYSAGMPSGRPGPGSGADRRPDDSCAPVWEANHVWLILIVVLLFTGFPRAFAAASIGLHVPLTLMLLGIVLRGSAWAFRRYGGRARWGRIFAVASATTPIFLGSALGAVTSGALHAGPDGAPELGFFRPWLAPFPLAVGAFALALFAYLAAVYVAVEAADPELRDAVRAGAIVSSVVVGACALAAGLLTLPLA